MHICQLTEHSACNLGDRNRDSNCLSTLKVKSAATPRQIHKEQPLRFKLSLPAKMIGRILLSNKLVCKSLFRWEFAQNISASVLFSANMLLHVSWNFTSLVWWIDSGARTLISVSICLSESLVIHLCGWWQKGWSWTKSTTFLGWSEPAPGNRK